MLARTQLLQMPLSPTYDSENPILQVSSRFTLLLDSFAFQRVMNESANRNYSRHTVGGLYYVMLAKSKPQSIASPQACLASRYCLHHQHHSNLDGKSRQVIRRNCLANRPSIAVQQQLPWTARAPPVGSSSLPLLLTLTPYHHFQKTF
jgi:hypothetical protein